MRVCDSILDAVGRTPLVRMRRLPGSQRVNLLAKVESLNPGGSVKDRVGLAMLEEAEKAGRIEPGATIIEATAGNTGVGLALAAAVKGYRCIFVLPDKMSADKVNLLKAYGAEVVITPTSVPPDSPESYNGVADRLAREIPGAFRPNQFANRANPDAHYRTTGPEIWQDTAGTIDVFVAGVGTGGTISGVGRYLKERKPEVVVVGADPEGSVLSGDSPKRYLVEGIGEDFVPKTFDRRYVDEFLRVSDRDSFLTARRMAREEGLLVGGSAGTAMAAALSYSQRATDGTTIVVLLPDTGRNYLSKFCDDQWMSTHGFIESGEPRATAGDVLRAKTAGPAVISVGPQDRAAKAIALLQAHGISQLPVIDNERCVGGLNEVTLVKLLHDRRDPDRLTVAETMGQPLPTVDAAADLAEPYRLLVAGHSGIVVTQAGRVTGFLTRADLVNFWSRPQGAMP